MRTFVYGTLTDPDRARAVDPDATFGPEATLSGVARVEGHYPTLVPGDSVVEGRVLDADAAALDAYEGVDRGLYARVSVPVAGGGTVETYVGDPAALGVDAAWPGEGTLAERAGAYLDEHAILRVA